MAEIMSMTDSRVPFPHRHYLAPSTGVTAHISGHSASPPEPGSANAFLSDHLETPLLDELYDLLWLIARKSGSHIDPLHVQKIKGRSIIPSEDPKLHLIWQKDRIYVKPVPICLLNYEFWATYLQPSPRTEANRPRNSTETAVPGFDRSIPMGFLRSYSFLIKSQLDFSMAKDLRLVPDDVDWVAWSRFINNFRKVENQNVAKRYHYGQLRLSRLNWVVRLYRPRNTDTSWFYNVPYWSIEEYVARAVIPLVFVFASLSLALSAMQVALSVPAEHLWSQRSAEFRLRYVSRASWGFSLSILLFLASIWILFFIVPVLVLLWQFSWGFQERKKRIRDQRNLN